MSNSNDELCQVTNETEAPSASTDKKSSGRRYLVRVQIGDELLEVAANRVIAILDDPRGEAEKVSAFMLALAEAAMKRRETTNIAEIAMVQRMAIAHVEAFERDRGLSSTVRALLQGMEAGRVTAERITIEK